jgi:outer membrane protein
MNTRLLPLMAAASLMLSAPVWAEEFKVGVVDAARVLENSPQAKAAKEKLEKAFAVRDQKLVAMQKEMNTLKEKLSREGNTMSEAERQKQEKELNRVAKDFKREQESFREDFNQARNQELQAVLKTINERVQAFAKAEKIDLLLSEGVVYASERVDYTKRVIESLSK